MSAIGALLYDRRIRKDKTTLSQNHGICQELKDVMNRNSKRIPRSLLRGQRANIELDSKSLQGNPATAGLQLAAGYSSVI